MVKNNAPAGVTTQAAMSVAQSSTEMFRINADGTIWGDWATLRKMHERFVAGERDDYVVFGAALWAARNM